MAFLRRLVRLLVVLITGIPFNTYVSLTARLQPADTRPQYRARWQQIGCRWLCTVFGLRASLEGEPVPEEQGLVVSNHFGGVEIIVLGAQMPVAFVAKAEMASWPLIGWITRTMGVIFVERGRPERWGSFLEQVEERLQAGVKVLAFPEGTTTAGDTLLPFKTGIFKPFAGREDTFIYPCYSTVKSVNGRPAVLEDQYNAAWTGGTKSFATYAWYLLGLKRLVLRVKIGPPLQPGPSNRKELAVRARKAVLLLADGNVWEHEDLGVGESDNRGGGEKRRQEP